MANAARILVLGTADWNQPIATNQHYMTRELAEAYDVEFVESLGLRRPEFNARDLRRIGRRLMGSAGRTEGYRATPRRVRVISPNVIPIHTLPWSAINKAVLRRQVGAWARFAGPRVFWTYSPVTYGLESAAHASVYHCVDLYGKYPGIDSKLIDNAERKLASSATVAIGSSDIVVKHLRQQGFKNVLHWENVADVARIIGPSAPPECETRHGAIFAGNLSPKKVDFDLLRQIVDAGMELHLAGPIAEGGGESNRQVLDLVSAGATYHGLLDLDDLSALMRRCRVGLIPYQLTPYTEGVSPLKTFEYLAAGLSVVSTRLPGVTPRDQDVFVESSPADVVARVSEQLVVDASSRIPNRLATAARHSWSQRGADARGLVATRITDVQGPQTNLR